MAINPAELMIGNYVMYKGVMRPVLAIDAEREFVEMGYKGTVTVPEYLPDGVTVFTTTGVWCNKVSPVTPTPEILERCGFKRHEDTINKNIFTIIVNGRQFEIGSDFATIDQFPTALYELTRLGVYHALTNVQYLHQLQNIIYSLTKTKLLLCNSN
jgi:hypothetical protein